VGAEGCGVLAGAWERWQSERMGWAGRQGRQRTYGLWGP